MSAEKCGEPVTAIMLDEAVARALEPRRRETVIISARAHKVLRMIKKIYPDWEPEASADVWVKAWKMGLFEEEE